MKRSVIALAVSAAFIATSASAADFNFSFATDLTDPSVINGVAGSVSGRILGLADSGTSSAASVFIDSYSAVGFASFPTDTLTWSTIFANSFTVSNGAITAANFHAERDSSTNGQLFINVPIGHANGSTNYASTGVTNEISIWNNRGLAGITFENMAAAVPEPATWGMMLVGFGMVGAAMRYRRRKATIVFA